MTKLHIVTCEFADVRKVWNGIGERNGKWEVWVDAKSKDDS